MAPGTDGTARAGRRRRSFRPILVALAALAGGCGPQLAHVGYAAPNKVWYHWVHGGSHLIVVCDVEPDGSETNCRETAL